jgi:sialate O-acetylesterase
MTRAIGLGLALLALAAGPAGAAVSLPAVLGEHMVVQRELPLHLWGQAEPGETVTASFRGESRSAVADELGRWSLHLPPSGAGGPFTLTLDASNTIRLDDVWVGDVWVAAGQSNMEWTLDAAEGGPDEIRRADHPPVRFLRAARVTSRFPLADVETDGWKVLSPQTAPKVSAIAYFFARAVRERHPVPVGVIDASWGGAPLAAFTPLTTIAGDPALQPAILHWSRMADRHATTLLEIEKEKRDLAAAAAQARARGEDEPRPRWRPGLEAWSPAGIYNAMIHPLTPHAIRGAIFYQGESDASPERAPVYARLFETTIRSWRRAWGVGDFPFLFVQLANWTAGAGNAWPELREAQRQTLSVANTGMAVTIDVGDPATSTPATRGRWGSASPSPRAPSPTARRSSTRGPSSARPPRRARPCASTSTTPSASAPAAGRRSWASRSRARTAGTSPPRRGSRATVLVSSPRRRGPPLGALRLGRRPAGQPLQRRPASRPRRSARRSRRAPSHDLRGRGPGRATTLRVKSSSTAGTRARVAPGRNGARTSRERVSSAIAARPVTGTTRSRRAPQLGTRRSGSIAVIERFFRTLETIVRLRTRPPLLRSDLERRLTLAWLRPHQGLAGATPVEVHLGGRAAHLDAITPPRGRPGAATGIPPPPFELRYLDPEHHLLYLVRKAAEDGVRSARRSRGRPVPGRSE